MSFFKNVDRYGNESVTASFAQVVYFNGTDPATATIFDTANPPVTNNNALKNLDNALYIGTDEKTWNSDGTAYSSYTAPAATEWYLTGTTTDAGGSKTADIYRQGKVLVATTSATQNVPLKSLHVQSGGATLQTAAFGDGLLFSTTSTAGARVFLEHLGAAVDRKTSVTYSQNGKTYVAAVVNDAGNAWVFANPIVVDHTSGYVGINNSTPSYHLDVTGAARITSTPITTVATYMLVKHPITGQISEQLINPVGGDPVYINGTDPTTATIFDDVNPPVANDNTLKAVTTNTYYGTDGSVWTYNGTTYVTKAFAAQGETDQFTATAGQTSFTLASTPKGKVWMFRNGARLPNTSFSVVGKVVTYVPANNGSAALGALVAGDIINIDYVK